MKGVRRTWYHSGFLMLVAATVLCLGPAQGGVVSGATPGKAESTGQYAEGEVLILVKPDVSRSEVEALVARHGMTILRTYRAMPQLFHVRLPAGLTVEAAIELLKAEAGVESAEPNYLVELQSACPVPCGPNDPQYPNQWGLTNIRAAEAWPISHGSSDAIVAILDTGLDRTHLDLQDNVWTNSADPLNGVDDDGDGYIDDYYGYNATADLCLTVPCPAGDPLDDDTSLNGHGTRLAGIIGAVGNNGLDMAGVGWHVKLLPIKIRYEPNRQSSLDLVLAGFDYVVAKRNLGVPIAAAHVSALVSSYSSALQAGINAMRNAGVLIIWSAGNDAKDVDTDSTDFRRPYDNVLFVGAIDSANQLASFSGYGQKGVNVAAPGVGILTIVRSGFSPPYPQDDGTSYSTPFVTGVVGLLSAWDPTLTYTQLKSRIISATTRTDGLAGKMASGGRLNAAGVFAAPITDLTPPGYQLARVGVGLKYYLDRTFTISSIPTGFEDLWWVRTKNADKTNTSANFVNIGLNQPSTVYVAYDPRAVSVPDWLSAVQGWTQTSDAIGVAGDPVGSLRIYARVFDPGTVVLGGNQATGYVGPASGDSSNYIVLVKPSTITPPSMPTNLAATAVSPAAIDLAWTASFDDVGVTGYTIYRDGVAIATTATNSYPDAGLTPNTLYTYTVAAFDGAGNVSAQSSPASATTPPDVTPPSIPTNLQASAVSPSLVNVSWTASVDDVGVAGYRLYRNGIEIVTTTALSYSDTGLAPATPYTYAISAFDAVGNVSAQSGSVTETTLALPTIKSRYSGSVAIPAGSASTTVTIAAVDPTRAFLVFGTSFNDANPGFSLITGQITNATTLTFKRATGSSSPAVTVKWYVAEFSSGVSVQRGSTVMNATTKNIALATIDPGRSVPIVSYRNSGSIYGGDDFVNAKITSGTNLELKVDASTTSGVVEWQVVQFTGVQVQTGDVVFAGSDGLKTAAITGVNTGKSWLIYSYKSQSGGSNNIGQKLVRGVITNPTTLTFDRGQTGQTINLTWYLVEFVDGTTVLHGSEAFASADTQRNVSIGSVDLATSLATAGYLQRGGKTSYSANDNPGVGWVTTDLINGTTLQITRGVTGSAPADIGWFVVSFAPPPAAPSGLVASDVAGDNGGVLDLAWTPSTSAGIVQQRVYRSVTSGGPYTLVATIADNTTGTYADSGVTNGTTYSYVVRAFNGMLESANSNQASATPVDNVAPEVPTGLSAADRALDNGGMIDLAWTPSVSADVTAQRVYRSTTTGGPYTLVATLAGNAATSYTDSVGLVNGTTYYYVIRAFDGTQESPDSIQASAVPLDSLPPPAPTGLNAVDRLGDNGGAITLTWTPSTASDVTEQRIYRSLTDGGPYSLASAIAGNATASYIDTGLATGTVHYYVLRAYDGTFESVNSNQASATPLDDAPPNISGVTSGGITTTGATITWATDEASDSEVEYGTTTAYGNSTPVDPSLVTSHSVELSGLAAATLYHYRVKSRDAAGNQAVSADFSVTTDCLPTQHCVQSGSIVLAAGSASVTVTITPVDPTKAFLVFGTSFNDSNPGFSLMTGQITNATTLTFRRSTGSGAPAVTIKWYVARFAGGVSVQRGSTTMSTTTKNVALTAIDPAKSVPIVSYRNPGSTYSGDDFIKAKITGGTNLELKADAASASGVVEWQVVEFAGAQVQTGDLALTSTDGVKTAAITGVNPAKSWLIYTYTSQAGTSANIGQKMVRGVVTDATTLTFDRNQTGQAINLTWSVVEFSGGAQVQQGSAGFGTTQTQRNIPISVIDQTRTLAAGGYMMRGGKTSYMASDNPGTGWATLDLVSGSTLRITRGVSNSATADLGWFVVSFPPLAPPSGLTAGDTLGDNGGAIDLAWTPSTAPDASEQRVYRSETPGGPYTLVATIADNTTGTYTDTVGLVNGTTYYYVIRASDGTQESVDSNEASAVPVDDTI